MGGLVSGNSNRYESASEDFREEQQPVVGGINGLFGRRRNSRKLSLRNLDVRADLEKVRTDHLAVPSANRHPFSDYRFNKKLGAGAFSTVYKCTSVFNETQTVAIKEVRTSDLTKDQLLDLQTEMNILSQVHHKNIVNLLSVFILPDKIFLVMEYLRGGELLKAICKRTCYEERDAKRIMIQIGDAVRYLHFRGVIHRDLKPENIILETKDFQSGIKIVDFGFAIVADDIQPRTKRYVKGTPGYMAPEVLSSGKYSSACDIWSLGVILYIILSGTMPFDARNKESVLEGKYHYPSKVWSTVSDEARNLIDLMIVKKAEDRISAADVLRHPWITSYYDDPLSGTVAANFGNESLKLSDPSTLPGGGISIGGNEDGAPMSATPPSMVIASPKSGFHKSFNSNVDRGSDSPSSTSSVMAMSPSSLGESSIMMGRQYRSPSLLHPIIELKDTETEVDKIVSSTSNVGSTASEAHSARITSRRMSFENIGTIEIPTAGPIQALTSNDANLAVDKDYIGIVQRSPRSSLGPQSPRDSIVSSPVVSSPKLDECVGLDPNGIADENMSIDSNENPTEPVLQGDLSVALKKMRMHFRILGRFAVGVQRFKQAGKDNSRRRAHSVDVGSIASISAQLQAEEEQEAKSFRNCSNLLASKKDGELVEKMGNQTQDIPANVSNISGKNGRQYGNRSLSFGAVTDVNVDNFLQKLKANNPTIGLDDLGIKEDCKPNC